MYKVLNKKRKITMAIAAVMIAALLGLWLCGFLNVNDKAFRQSSEYYSMSDTVSLDGNFMFDGTENTNGYSIKVNSLKLMDYAEFWQEQGKKAEDISDQKYFYLMNLTVTYDGDSDGYINTMGLMLLNGALQIPVDYEIWDAIDENIDGSIILRLRPHSQTTLDLPLTPQLLDEHTDPTELYKRMKNDDFSFIVSFFPTRKYITVKLT